MKRSGEARVKQKSQAAWGKTAPSQGFRGIYINLDRSKERRQNVERQLVRLGLGDTYVRLPAIDGRKLKAIGDINPGIVGCFRSHAAALEMAAGARSAVHIVEDDVVLSTHTAPFVRHAIGRGLLEEYDIVFLDMWVDPLPEQIRRYLPAVQRAFATDPLHYERFSALDLKGTRIGAAASYLISPSKLDKVTELVRAELAGGPTVPIDHYYGVLTGNGALKTAVVAPFLTTIDLKQGALSDTQTLPELDHRLFLLLRNAFYVERDLKRVVIPAMDEYRRLRPYKGLDEIRNLLAASAGIPPN